jgi:hypothetical protein
MSVKVMAEVWDLDLPDSEKLVLLAFADFSSDAGICYPSIARITQKCCISESTVHRIIASLRRGELLRPIANASGGQGKAVVYEVHPEKGVKLTPFREAKNRVSDFAMGVKTGYQRVS